MSALSTPLKAVLPVPARITAELAATLQTENHPGCRELSCSVTSISYAGDKGGIVCKLELGEDSDRVVYEAGASPWCRIAVTRCR